MKEVNFSKEFLEIKERLQKIEGQLTKEETLETKEKIVKQEIKDYLQETEQAVLTSPATTSQLVKQDEIDEIRQLDPVQQVGALVLLVFHQGLPKAISIAQALNNPALLDAFHDTLVDQYYEMLCQKKILEF